MDNFHKILLFVAFMSHQLCADPVVRNPIFETVDFLTLHDRENTEEILSLSQTQQFVDVIWERTGHCDHALDACQNCLQGYELFDIIEADTSLGLQERQFEQISVVLLYHLEIKACRLPEESGANMTYADYLEGLFLVPAGDHDHELAGKTAIEDLFFSEEQLHHVLDVFKGTYTPASENKCFTEHSVFHDSGLEDSDKVPADGLELLSSVVLSNLLHGECIGSSNIVNPDSFVEEIFHLYGEEGVISDHDFEHVMTDLGLFTDGHDHLTLKRSATRSEQRRSISLLTEEHDHANHSHCYTPDQLLEVFGTQDGIAYSSFLDMCPSLIHMLVTDACHEDHEVAPVEEPSSMVYVWATLAVFALILASVSGIVLFPLLSPKIYQGMVHFCMALAVSTLSGDALLHILPVALGLHNHSSDGHAHEESTEPEYVLGKIMAVVGAIYVFFVFEKGLGIVFGRSGHSHGNMDQTIKGIDNPVDVLENEAQENTTGVKHATNGNTKSLNGTAKSEHCEPSKISYSHDSGVTLDITDEEKNKPRGIATISAMLLIGDVMCNFMDGIAIGVAFTLDYFVGISTCIAIFCHEFPREMGNFAIFTKHGMTKAASFTLIIMSNLCGLGGVYSGIALGSNDAIHHWILAITAGFFLYLSLVDLMPEMLRDPDSSKPSVFILYNMGLLLGWFILTTLAYFEEDIYNMF